MTRFSCITTTFNDGAALLASVESVLGQSHGDLQYIVVDDGSADETPDLLAGIRDDRLLLIAQANDGLSGARNKALERVTGDYVCFLDSDDTRPPWALAAIAALIERDDPDLVLCRGVLADARGDLRPFYDDARFDRAAALTGGAVAEAGSAAAAELWPLAQMIEPQSANKVVRRALLDSSGARFPNTHFFEDIYFHTDVLAAARRLSFLHSPAFAYFQRYRRPQITGSSSDRRFDILPVTRMTLESFARSPHFSDPLYRAAVLASCFKLVFWCESRISHRYRHQFGQGMRALLRLVDPGYLVFPGDGQAGPAPDPDPARDLPEDLAWIRPILDRIRRLTDA